MMTRRATADSVGLQAGRHFGQPVSMAGGSRFGRVDRHVEVVV
jgi:hypothetical protein